MQRRALFLCTSDSCQAQADLQRRQDFSPGHSQAH